MRGIIVFVKNPVLGKVKTRLAATLGDQKALEIYNKLVDYTRGVLEKVGSATKYVYYSDFIDMNDEWPNVKYQKNLQYDGTLGQRIVAAFQETFSTCEKVIIIGSDCPQLTSSVIEAAFAKLESHNIVIGPSTDGGYYLLGMDNVYPQLFQNINWSTNTVFQETFDIAQKSKLSIHKLKELTDIDFEEDWVKYGF